MFSTQSDKCTQFVHIFDIISLFPAKLEKPKIGIAGNRLNKWFIQTGTVLLSKVKISLSMQFTSVSEHHQTKSFRFKTVDS